jgi:protein-S-isoprenylcysteine O-methyltransferase Ste14
VVHDRGHGVMGRRALRGGALLLLALVFTAGLTFATLELPRLVDGLLQSHVRTPGGDSHADAVARLKTDLFMAHYHVRTLGYAAFFLLLGLIVVGFCTRRTGLAALGAFGVMLPVFAQFASVMFFLAGLGVLNAVWLPVLDVSYELQGWGRVIDAPNDALRWLLGLVGIHSPWPTILFFTGGGILIFLLGVYAWLKARAEGAGVATSRVYRISRHPQYLGWILWTYGAYLVIQLARYPRRSWGIGASFPWLLSTMVIIAVALTEELQMRQRHGEAYESYRRSAPFLFPVPRVVERALSWPYRFLSGMERPGRKRDVVAVTALYTAVLVGLSVAFYGGGLDRTLTRLRSSQGRAARMSELAAGIPAATSYHGRARLMRELVSFGEPAVEPITGLLLHEDAAVRSVAAEGLESLRSERAVAPLCAVLGDEDDGVRFRAAVALGAVGSRDAVPCLFPLLDDPAGHVRVQALLNLADVGTMDVLSRVPAYLADEGTWVRSAGLAALGALGAEEGIPLATPGLSDEEPAVRREAVIALLRIGSPLARPALERATEDDDWETRIYAAEALKRLPADVE